MKTLIEVGCWLILIVMMLCVSLAHAGTLRVGVVDTGLDLTDSRFLDHLCPVGHQDFTGMGIKDHAGHGTHVAGLIQQYAKDSDYCLVILKYSDGGEALQSIYTKALAEAVYQHLDIVNLSLQGFTNDDKERSLICDHNNIQFVVSAGNKGWDLDKMSCYPASYACGNELVVGALNYSGSNYGTIVTNWENGLNVVSTLPDGQEGTKTGTSQATAIRTGKLIYEKTHQHN